ncbi:hypothetical protein [Shimia sp. NS0008-38b]|uniref:hypothetical protein n=1 Tax=Shimia sp. NS0008-38b TaxID=3127653 RepID=UPI0033400C67
MSAVTNGLETNEGVDDAAQLTATMGRYKNDVHWGGIVGAGQIRFIGDDADQDMTYGLVGGGIGVERGSWAYGGSLMLINATAADNAETLDNAVLAKFQAEYALAAERSWMGVYALYADGDQDADGGADKTRGPGAGIYLRQQIGTWGARNDVMLNAGLDIMKLKEAGGSGTDTTSATKAYVGVSIALGRASTPRAMRMASAPESGFLQLLTPYAD